MKRLLLFLALVCSAGMAQAQVCTAASNGTWFATARWNCTLPAGSRIPLATDNVVIGNFAITIDTANAVAASVNMASGNSNGSLTVNTGRTLTVGGNVNLSAATLAGNTRSKTITVAGSLSAGSLTLDGQGFNTRQAQLVINNGTVTVGGNVTVTANTDSDILFCTSATCGATSGGTLNVGGNLDNGAAFNAGTGTVNYNGAGAQTLATYAYNNLSVTKSSGTASLATSVTVDGNLSVTCPAVCGGGTLDLSTFTADRTAAGGTITVGAGARLIIGGTNTFPANYATHTLAATSTVEYAGTSQAIAAENYGNLTISGARGANTVTLAGAGTIGVAGTFSPTATFAGGGYVITGSTVNFNGTTAQTIAAFNYENLTITKSASTGTLGGASTVNGTLTIASGTFDVAANNLTVTGPTSITGTLTHSSATGTKQYGGLVTVNAGGTWNNSGNSSINFRGGLTHNGSAFTAGTGVYTFDTNAQAIGGLSAITIPNVTVTGITLTNNNATATGLTVSTTLAGTGGVTQGTNSVLRLGGTSTITTLDAASNANTVIYNGGSAQTVKATTYRNLCANNGSGLSLTADATVNGALTFMSGRVTTAANTLTLGPSATIGASASCTAGTLDGTRHVVGNLAKAFSAAGSFLYPVGDGTNYIPVTVTFSASGFTAGSLTVSSANGGIVNTPDHPNTTSGTDGLNKDKSVNRYWTIKRPAASAIAGSYTALFQYPSADLDGGTTASSLVFQQGSGCSGSGGTRACSSWTQRTTTSSSCASGNPSITAACATNPAVPASATESDFALGEVAGPSNFAREKQFIYTREQY